jgi:hypothetical protein
VQDPDRPPVFFFIAATLSAVLVAVTLRDLLARAG